MVDDTSIGLWGEEQDGETIYYSRRIAIEELNLPEAGEVMFILTPNPWRRGQKEPDMVLKVVDLNVVDSVLTNGF